MTTSGRPIDRRAAVQRVVSLLGGTALVGGTSLLSACLRRDARGDAAARGVGPFTPDDVALLDEIADTLLPETGTPGARAAAVGGFMALMVTDTYAPEDQATFRDGLAALEAECRARTGGSFREAAPAERLALLEALDREQHAHTGTGSTDQRPHYFRMMKELALLGYFTSEIGYTQAMRYVESPGRFDPCIPYQPGDRAWAPHA